jgi:hypothetical protein
MENSFFVNLNREINSPLNQFDVREFVSITVNVLGNLNLAITNIAVFLTMSGFYLLFSNLLSTYYNKVVGNSWSISQESLYVTILSIVTNQINYKNGQKYFPFIYALFIFILINNLIGMVQLTTYFKFIDNNFTLGDLKISKTKVQGKCSVIRWYSTSSSPSNDNPSNLLNPHYLTGFIDGEGCFNITINKHRELATGWRVNPVFKISLHNRDIALLEQIQKSLGVGSIYRHGENSADLRIFNLNNLSVVIKHLDKYPLITKKQAAAPTPSSLASERRAKKKNKKLKS